MAKGQTEPKELKPWDRRPWPTRGTRSLRKIYASVGECLSEWERYEGVLSRLFSRFVGTDNATPAQRAYNAIRTFEARAEMLKAASQAYFTIWPNDDLQNQFKQIISGANCYAPRRNEIAHGAVDHFYPQRFGGHPPFGFRPPASFALYPSYANFKDRNLENAPGYCYTSTTLDYFFAEFRKLRTPAEHLATPLVHNRRKHELSRQKSLAPSRT
jgi:hypothetical protein